MPEAVQYESVVAYLIRLRLDRGLLQADVAKRLGKGQQYVSRVENRLRRLDVAEFYAYVRALGADPTEVITAIYRQAGVV